MLACLLSCVLLLNQLFPCCQGLPIRSVNLSDPWPQRHISTAIFCVLRMRVHRSRQLNCNPLQSVLPFCHSHACRSTRPRSSSTISGASWPESTAGMAVSAQMVQQEAKQGEEPMPRQSASLRSSVHPVPTSWPKQGAAIVVLA